MTTPAVQRPAALANRSANPPDTAALQEALKRCSPATLDAAFDFRRSGDPTFLEPLVVGVIERFVERGLRSRLIGARDDLRLVEDLGLDSLTLMEIVLLLEDVLCVSVSNEELLTLRTIGDVRAFIVAKAAANPVSPRTR